MSSWCVMDPMIGRVIVVEAKSALKAAEQAFVILVDEHPDETTCDQCESVTISRVEVWPCDQSKAQIFERLPRVREVRGE